MAIYTTFFLARPEALAAGFPGWKAPLPAPVRREWTNPFTKQVQVFETFEPPWDEDAAEPAPPQVVAIRGSYEAYLEARLPPFVRDAPHWAAKGLSQIEVEPLLVILKLEPAWKSVLYAPPTTGKVLQALPARLCDVLVATDPGVLAAGWAAALSTPEHTHNVRGERLLPDLEVDDARGVVDAWIALARRAADGDRMYLLTEP